MTKLSFRSNSNSPPLLISSAANEKIKRLIRLRDGKARRMEHTAVLEGYRIILRALECGVDLREIYFCRDFFLGHNEDSLIACARERGAAVFETTAGVFAKFAYRDRPEGLLATMPTVERGLSDLRVGPNPCYVVLESIEKPGNLGAILRSADAVAADGVIVCEKRTDIYNPNAINASTGAIFTVPVAEDSSRAVCSWLRENKIKIVAASPHAEKLYTQEDLASGVAIVLGSEQYGLSRFWMEESDALVAIPMLGMADSLNVAISATLLLYESARQRGWKKER